MLISREDKIKWMKSLKVGNVVCDCKFDHLTINKIEEVYMPKQMSTGLASIILHDKVPVQIVDAFLLIRDWFCSKLGIVELVDKDLYLEDGGWCSAIHCCDPVNHTEPHPK